MHSRAKGKSGSKRPIKKVASWSPYKGNEVEKLIIKYAKAGKTSSEIGVILRDSYGINSIRALTGKKVGIVLQEKELSKDLPEDLLSLIRKVISIKQHMEKNKQDQTAKRGLGLTTSKINRLIKYYKRTKILAPDWNLDMDRLKMYLE